MHFQSCEQDDALPIQFMSMLNWQWLPFKVLQPCVQINPPLHGFEEEGCQAY
jgi:hypothetical protein